MMTVYLILRFKANILKILGICTAVIILVIGLRPMLPNGETFAFKSNVDVIFVMDGTLSMLADDGRENNRRIDAVIEDIQYIINKIPNAYYSLIEFDNKSHINLRSTVDQNAAVIAAKTTHQIDEFHAKGTAVTIFKSDLLKILESSNKKEGRKRAVFIMTDGENTSKKDVEKLDDLKEYIDAGAVLGYGTTQGGKMKVERDYDYDYGDPYLDSEYIQDWSVHPPRTAISKLDEENLQKIAGDLNLQYIHMDEQHNINPIIDEVKSFQGIGEEEKEFAYDDIYYYLSFPLILLLIVEFYLIKKELL